MSTLSANAKAWIATSAVSVVLTAVTFQCVGSYLYQTPHVINAAVVSHKFEKLKNEYGDEFAMDLLLPHPVYAFFLDPTSKLVAHPNRNAAGEVTTYKYEFYEGSNWRRTYFGGKVTFPRWYMKTASERERLKKEWGNEGALQDWEAVNQYIKDFEESQKNAPDHQ